MNGTNYEVPHIYIYIYIYIYERERKRERERERKRERDIMGEHGSKLFILMRVFRWGINILVSAPLSHGFRSTNHGGSFPGGEGF